MRSELVEQAEYSSDKIQIHTPSLNIRCQILRNMMDILYNLTIGSTSCQHILLTPG